MEDKIKKAFDSVKAEDLLKEKTRLAVLKQMKNQEKPRKRVNFNLKYAVCALALVIFSITGYNLYFTTTAIISVDINPSVEINVNRFNKVISVNGYNEDGVALAENLNILFKNYTQAIDEILENDTVKNCLSDNGLLSIGVVDYDNQQSAEIYRYVSRCTSNQKNMQCYSLKSEDVDDAHSLGLSCGKYNAYLMISEVTDIYTPEQINSMTMREINDLLNELGIEQTVQGRHGQGHSQCHKMGMGNNN